MEIPRYIPPSENTYVLIDYAHSLVTALIEDFPEKAVRVQSCNGESKLMARGVAFLRAVDCYLALGDQGLATEARTIFSELIDNKTPIREAAATSPQTSS